MGACVRNLLAAFAVCAMASPAAAVTINIFQHSAYLDWNENPGATTIAAPAIDGFAPAFDGTAFTAAGFSVSFSAALDVDNLGTLTWTIINTGLVSVTGVRFFAYLDAEFGDVFFDEYAAFEATGLPAGAPAGAIAFSSFEADDPDPFFGDILANLVSGTLDNSIDANQTWCEENFGCDVALALGFLVGSLAAGEGITATLLISEFVQDAPGLSQTDPDSAESILFNGYVEVRQVEPPVAVPAPPAL
ncbi:MAG TPA: hypothetical protein VGA24_08040, partial [Steroidobacteraceae bacterium]